MKKIILIVLPFASFSTFSQSFDCVSQIVGATAHTYNDITTDAAQNVYASGQFSGYVDFDPTGGSNSINA